MIFNSFSLFSSIFTYANSKFVCFLTLKTQILLNLTLKVRSTLRYMYSAAKHPAN